MANRQKVKIPNDTRTYIHIMNLGMDLGETLDQYNTTWMPAKLKKQYTHIQAELNKLVILAEKLSAIEYED